MSKMCGEIDLERTLGELSREDLAAIIAQYGKDGLERANDHNYWLIKCLATEHDNKRLKQIITSEYHNGRNINHEMHVADLEAKVKRLKREVRVMQEASEHRNALLNASRYIVNCTGCDAGGPADFENLTDADVKAVELIARRLRTWWNNHEYRSKGAGT